MLSWMQEIFAKFAGALMDVLPTSPFREFIVNLDQGLWAGWLNWLFPVEFCLNVMAAWLGAITVFYLYSIVMRWVKMIGD